MRKLAFVMLLSLVVGACKKSANERLIDIKTVTEDVAAINEEMHLNKHLQKTLESIEFIADNKEVNPKKVEELFLKFEQAGWTYDSLFVQANKMHRYVQGYEKSFLTPLYMQIDSLCIARQNIVDTTYTVDPLSYSFLNNLSQDNFNHHYKTPEILYGDCPYLFPNDQLFLEKMRLEELLEQNLSDKFKILYEFNKELNQLFNVHR